MKYKKPVFGIYFLICSFSAVLADNASEFEQELQLEPPGFGYSPDAVSIYSRMNTKNMTQAVDKQFSDPENSTPEHYLKVNKDGIKVYIYKQKNSVFGTFKAITHINSSLDSVLAVILDNQSLTKWLDSCINSILLKRINFYEQYHYQVLSIPVPFTNRDFILHSRMDHNPATNAITITMSSAANYCHDQSSIECNVVNQSKLVRVTKSIGTFKLQADKNGTKITWIQHTDPGGYLPGWLVNHLLHKTPYLSLKNLARKVKERRYKQAKLIYAPNGIAIALKTPVKYETPGRSANATKDFQFLN